MSTISTEQDNAAKAATYCVEAKLVNLAAIRAFVREWAEALDAPPALVSDLLLATDEATTNVILHGYRGEPGTIRVSIMLEEADVIIHIRDNAPPFDPTGIPPPDLLKPLDERAPGGLGIFVINDCMDQVCYCELPGEGNLLILRKKRVIKRSR